MRIALVYNPRMAPRRLGRVIALAAALKAQGHQASHYDTLSFHCARDAPDAELLCVAGGDGTLRMIVGRQGDRAALPPLAVFPVGTVNLVARELGYPGTPQGFVRRIEQDRAFSSPLALLNGEPFVACASVGIDAMAVASLSDGLKARIGRMAYAEAMRRLLISWPRHLLTVSTDSETFTAEAVFVLRARFYAGPWTLHPEAHLGHDTLRVLALPLARRRDIAGLATRAFAGVRAQNPGWRYLETTALEVSADRPVPIQADGDPAGVLPARIEMGGDRLRFR